MNRSSTYLLACFLLTGLLACSPADPITEAPLSDAREETPPAAPSPAATLTAPPASPVAPTLTPTAEPAPPTLEPTQPQEEAEAGPPIPHLAAGQPITITQIEMFSPTSGWALGGEAAVGDHVFRTSDGGLTWQDVTPPQPVTEDPEYEIEAIGFFLDLEHAWVTFGPPWPQPRLTSPTIWRTADGGRSWEPAPVPGAQGLPTRIVPQPLLFSDTQHGWLMIYLDSGMSHAYVDFFRTQDGGTTWDKIVDPMTAGGLQGCCKTGMVFADSQTGLVSNGQGPHVQVYVERTLDGGETWLFEPLPEPGFAAGMFERAFCEGFSPHLFTPEIGLLGVECIDYEDEANPGLYLYATKDGGATWQALPYPGGELLFIDQQTGWALGRDIYQTLDSGATWALVKSVNWDGQFSFVSSEVGWAVATADEEIALVRTTDGGNLWELITPVVGP